MKNNPDKFPKRFSWFISDCEYNDLRSKTATSRSSHGGRRYNPRVFTEQGVAMLATVLKSKIATEVSIRIMDAFVSMRHFIIENKDIYKSLNNINNKLIEYDEKINYIFSKFDKKEQLFLPGETYEAYTEIANIIKETKKEIIIIDGYADKTLLDYIKDINSKIILITSSKTRLSSLEVEKFNKQYNKLEIKKTNVFHDRYLIIDKNEIYHIGTSLNHIGEKLFSINKLEDKFIKDNLISYVCEIIYSEC